MSAQRGKLHFILGAILWSTLLFGVSINAQDDPCEVYGDGYVCSNDTRTVHSVPFDDPLTCEQNMYENVMKLLDDGQKILEQEFALTDKDEAVMMIGNSGTGKSTLTYFLAGDNRKMFSYEAQTDLFLIKDCNGKIGSGDSTIVSATIYPDLVIENSTGTPFYDNPGFQDTRTACVEIANAYFMQKIANHIKKVKFVIVVNKNEVTVGQNREDFPRALRNVFNFVPNIEKFGTALGLVATKLDARKPTDDPYVKDVVDFMTSSRSSFPEIFPDPDELRKANFIVDSIANVSRVGVFRMPVECGPLSEMDLMQQNRANIIKVILENMQYVDSSPEDFALTISPDAQIKVQAVGLELGTKIKNFVQTFSTAIYNFSMFQFICVQNNNCDDLVEDLKILFSNPDFINEYDVEDFAGLSYLEVVERIMNPDFVPPKALDSLPVGFVEDVVKRAGHLDFMNNLASLNVDTKSWLQLLKDTRRYLKEHVGGLISDIDQTFVKVLRELSEDFQGVFEKNLKGLIEGKLGDSTQLEAAVVGLYESSYNLSQNVDGLEPSRYVREISENFQLFKIGFSDQGYLNSQLLILSELSLNLDFLVKSFNSSFSVNPESWVAPLISLKANVSARIDSEIKTVTKDIGYLFSELLLVFEDHYSQLSRNSEELPYEILDIARRQFDFLNTFTKSVSQGQARKDFVTNLNSASNSINSIFIILGSQNFILDINRLDSALVILERLNIGEIGVIPAEWVLKIQSSTSTILHYVVGFASTDVNNVVQIGAASTAAALTARLLPAYEVTDYPFDKQRNFIEDYQKIQGLVTEISTCTTLKCFSSKNFKILSQLSQAVTLSESSLQKLPGQNLQVDLNDLGQNPYKISEWIKPYQDSLAVLTTIKNQLKADRPELTSPTVTNWGTWAEDFEMCPDGTFVSGMKLKDDQCSSGGSTDCVAVSGVSFFCSPLDSGTIQKTITSSVYAEGDWRDDFTCTAGLKAVGFELNVDTKNKALNGFWDDLSRGCCCWEWPPWECDGGPDPPPPKLKEATVNMRLFCEDGTTLEGDKTRDDNYGGSWSDSEKKSCKTGQYLCGLKTQVELTAGGDDDLTGLNNVDVKCCYIVS